MQQIPSITLIQIEGTPKELSDTFLSDTQDLQVEIEIKERPNYAMLSYDWAIPTAIFLYITKPYIETILKEAAKDHYPILKNSIANFIKRIKTTFPKKIDWNSTEDTLPFSIYSEIIEGGRMKFIFLEEPNQELYLEQVEKLLIQLQDYHLNSHNSSITKEINDKNINTILGLFLLYDKEENRWKVIDLKEEILKREAIEK